MGEICRIPEGFRCCLGQRQVLLRVNEENDARFVLYAIQSPIVQNEIGWNEGTGSTVSNVRIPVLKALNIPRPPLREQQEIAETLGLIDDKIELNRQTARTLEELAQRLFKSWFVDFDPVRAKMAGRQPAHTPPEIADLFPDRLVDSPLGPIPAGWDVVEFSEEFDFTMGQSPPGSTYNEAGEGKPFFQGKADFGEFFPCNRIFCSQPTRYAKAMDVLFSVRAPVGSINLALEYCTIGRGLCAIRHRLGSAGVSWCWVKEIADHIEGLSGEGALFKSLSKKQLTWVPVIRKPAALLAATAPLFDEFVDKLSQLELETRTLTQLRDRLLPKLISGEIRVPEAQEIAEESVS